MTMNGTTSSPLDCRLAKPEKFRPENRVDGTLSHLNYFAIHFCFQVKIIVLVAYIQELLIMHWVVVTFSIFFFSSALPV